MSRKRSMLTINDEIRRLQRTMAVLVCIQAAAADDTEADLGDALAVVVALVGDSLQGLDRLEASSDREVSDGRK
jgi:hypothetical protein